MLNLRLQLLPEVLHEKLLRMGQIRISALAPWSSGVAAHLNTLWVCAEMQKALLWGALSVKETNGSVILQGGKAWNLP